MLSKKELKQLHGQQYVKDFESKQSKHRLKRLISLIDFNEQSKVVDFGCGNGMLFSLIDEKVGSYTGIDFSEEFIDLAKVKHKIHSKKAEFICDDIVNFGNKHQREYDLAFAMDFSEHVYDDDWIEILRSIRNTLKIGGKLYIHTPNSDFLIEILKKHNFILKQFPEHIAVRNMKDNCNLITQSGYKISKKSYLAHYNILKVLHIFSFIPFIGKFFKARIFIEAKVPNE